MAEVGLGPALFDGGSAPIPYAALGRLIALGTERTGCRHLGLLVGQRTALASLGLIGLLMRHSDTVGDALRALEEHLGMQNRGAVVGLGVAGGVAVLSYSPYEPGAEGAALHSERALATATNVLRVLCGADWAPLEVLLPRSAPHDTAPYGSFFRAPVRFDEEVAALVFPAGLLKQRIAGADPVIRRKVEERLRRLAAAQPPTRADELRRYLCTEVTRNRCKAEKTARLMLLNRRTLSRRLRAEGTSFKQLANETQFGLAQQLLADTSMSLGQVSAVLHFSEPAAFSHAFRRWSGMTPSAWRQANRQETTRDQHHEDPHPRGKGDIKCGGTFALGLVPS
ncbi:AraC-like DNA-binding protein [Methylobacterium sp. BE186]|nr:AraC-like DNA-binding protein [Methylobacterium sp. BE186]